MFVGMDVHKNYLQVAVLDEKGKVAVNPSVTQENFRNTICVPGYTKTLRPPVSYTTPLKIRLMQSYGFNDSRSNYELDHLIPLEIGGNPYDVRNLWSEPGYGEYNFHIKDRYENYLNNAVCSGFSEFI